ncbi:MAG: propionyl-CoA carboxylase [Planctomycetota bacterium]|nr:MAG: propionyl-CoA carboxylase [Planctomycetota bacterium]
MAKVILQPIGDDREKFLDQSLFAENQSQMEALEREIEQKRKSIRQGWGQKYIDRVHKKGKLTAYERIEELKDPPTPFLPIGTFVNWAKTFGEDRRTSPAAGVITGFAQVAGRYVVVIANDNTVASGSWWPQTPEKIQRAQEVALRLRLPVVYLVDCSGLYLPEQSQTFAGKRGAGHIFKMNSLLSHHQVPQIAGVFGDCIAGGGYMPIISDKVFMTEQAYMVIAGAALIRGGKSQNITSLSIGGPDVHVHLSRCADERAPTDREVLQLIRKEIETLPSSATTYYRFGADPMPPRYSPEELRGIFPTDYRMPYDIYQVLARLVDASLFWEILPHTGQEMVVGIARIAGLYAGIIANNLLPTPHPLKPELKRPGGILYKEGIAKISLFSRACNDDGIPILWLQDISGFDIGTEAEKNGLLGYGSNLIYTNSTNQTPMIAVLLRKASGAGYYAMCGAPYDPILQISTPLTRLAVMEGRTLAIGTYHTKLDDNFNIQASSEEEYRQIQEGMRQVEARIEQDMDPVASASRMDTDEVVLMGELRMYLEALVKMCYQSIGYRRVKNPRIWSLHDIWALEL